MVKFEFNILLINLLIASSISSVPNVHTRKQTTFRRSINTNDMDVSANVMDTANIDEKKIGPTMVSKEYILAGETNAMAEKEVSRRKKSNPSHKEGIFSQLCY